jgi:hypothetical protein
LPTATGTFSNNLSKRCTTLDADMKRCILFPVVLLMVLLVNSQQTRFSTLVPQEPVVAGEAFRVQYVAIQTNNLDVETPEFPGFRLVNGPIYYKSQVMPDGGSQVPPYQNATYTLVALKPGRYDVPGTLGILDGKQYTSSAMPVTVISRQEADRRSQPNGGVQDDPSIFFLQPGEDPYKRMEKDLFVRVTVDKQNCFVGQPVVATFKLYSRLRSRSDIIKNPGFYGFSVHDMVNLEDKQLTTEKINGRLFDVHTIRQVSLYPLQEGEYMIEAMTIRNRALFRKSIDLNSMGDNEPEVREGIIDDSNDPKLPKGVEAYENEMSTAPVKITVKPVPVANKPADFNGATGNFSISASLEKNTLARNEEGHFIITIKGAGNFNQLSPPVIQWPEGIEGFEPLIDDTLDKKHSPLNGSKIFKFGFVSAKSGNYQLPAIHFSFFDPAANAYKQVTTTAQQVQVTQEEKIVPVARGERKTSIADVNRKVSIIAAGIIITAILIALGYWLTRKKEVKPAATETAAIQYKSASEFLANAQMLVPAEDNSFYRVLQRSTWDFFRQHFDFAGSDMRKETLAAKLRERKINPGLIERIMQVLQECETGIYTGLVQQENREQLLQDTKQALDEAHSYLLRHV